MSFDSILKKLVKSSLKQLAAATKPKPAQKPKPAHKAKPRAKPSTKIEGVTAHTREMTALNAAKIEAIRQNADVAPAMRWLSVLDSHSCILCGVRDGKEWDTLTLEPVGHSIPFTSPPLHRGCRCTAIPVTRLTKRADELGIGQRASTFGPVPRTTTFEEFLKQRDTAFQDGVLGEDRAKIWRDAKLSLDQLVDESGRELTLAELRGKYSV